MDGSSMRISIPSDEEGFVLLQCPKCGEFFKLLPSDIESDEVTEIHCPLCGLVSGSYWTEDVIRLAEAKVINYAINEIYKEFKELERTSQNSFLKVKATKPKEEDEIPVRSTIDAMEIVNLKCCNRKAKIRPLLNYCGCYCPYCGGKTDGNN